MNGTCSHCGRTGIVWRYRLTDVGLRFLLAECYERLAAMGMNIAPVTTAEPRVKDLGPDARRLPGIGQRIALAWRLRHAA